MSRWHNWTYVFHWHNGTYLSIDTMKLICLLAQWNLFVSWHNIFPLTQWNFICPLAQWNLCFPLMQCNLFVHWLNGTNFFIDTMKLICSSTNWNLFVHWLNETFFTLAQWNLFFHWNNETYLSIDTIKLIFPFTIGLLLISVRGKGCTLVRFSISHWQKYW